MTCLKSQCISFHFNSFLVVKNNCLVTYRLCILSNNYGRKVVAFLKTFLSHLDICIPDSSILINRGKDSIVLTDSNHVFTSGNAYSYETSCVDKYSKIPKFLQRIFKSDPI